MLCRKFKQVPVKLTNNKPSHTQIASRHFSKKCLEFLDSVRFVDNMSSTFRLRHFIKDLVVTRLLSGWRRNFLVNTVVKRCRRDRAVRDVIQCFKHAFFKPRRTFFLSVTAAYKARNDGPPSCGKDITDADLQALASEMDGVEELARATLYCKGCDQRVVFDKKLEGVLYCACKDSPQPDKSFDGWVPYMEAEDVIIWRKEYKPGLFAYKVYGQYKEIMAEDFAAIQVDGAYRRVWDSAVAALSIVERQANGVPDQTVLHWEVLWPRFFANRDYVYLRRHKQFDVKSKCLKHKEGIFNPDATCKESIHLLERPNVHSNAKRISIENELKEQQKKDDITKIDVNIKDASPKIAVSDPKIAQTDGKDSKVYVIISRSCTHPKVPVTRNAIRVTNYWSHMVIKTLNGPEEVGTEFILTYYDEPTVGGLPTALTSFATGRAVPAFLSRMRRATNDYTAWRAKNKQEAPDFIPFGPEKVSYQKPQMGEVISEEDMESSKLGPDLDGDKLDVHENGTSSRGTQTDQPPPPPVSTAYEREVNVVTEDDEKFEKPTVEKSKDPPPEPPQPPSPPPYSPQPNCAKETNDDTTTEKETLLYSMKGLRELIVEDSPFYEDEVIINPAFPPIWVENVHEHPEVPPTPIPTKQQEENPKQHATDKNVHNEAACAMPEGDSNTPDGDCERVEEGQQNNSWWRYLYPFYYFV